MRSFARTLVLCLVLLAVSQPVRSAEPLDLTLRYRTETTENSGRYDILTREESWQPSETAIIVCDMWDLHHCLNATRREGEFAPRLNNVLNRAREQGVTIIHSPSSCMDFYEGHAARERAKAAPVASNLPNEIGEWCHQIPAEERGKYPVDQSDGGEDDDPDEHVAWAAKLEAMGRNPRAPWKRQIDVLTIDANRDYISDQGDEVWNILEDRGIRNVILTGVHTNMCVLGRPFGLRQMARNGKNVVLMRDLTDTMYNPKAWPYVSHFTGTDLIVEHIEKFVCPTITSDQLIRGGSFVFSQDTRTHIVMLIGEKEYRTNETLPMFALEHLGSKYRVTIIHASEEDKNMFPGIEAVKEADLLFVSVRRRTPPPEQLQLVRDHVAAGKPVIGIRTASHAFTLRNQPAPEGYNAWPEFDAEVFGGNYSNHHGNELVATVNIIQEHADHTILIGVPTDEFTSDGSLYVVSPLAVGATPLLMGRVEGHDPEPMAWIYIRDNGGRSFYTSLGYPGDFETPSFVQILKNAVNWTTCRMER
ncbi:MAG: isochorismatase family protein [Planctomycetaceae bacterium]